MRTHPYFKLAAITATSCLALLANTATAKDAPTLTIQNFIGTIDMQTGDYDKITVRDADGADVDQMDANVLIDDDQSVKNINCRTYKGNVKISIGKRSWLSSKGNYKNIDEYPQLRITAPEDTHLVIDKVVIFGDVGDIGSADIKMRSCGDLVLSDVNGHTDLGIAGSGDFTAQNLQSLEVGLAGSGDVKVADIEGSVDIASAGSGDNEIGNIGGDLSYASAGSGDLNAGNILGNAGITTAGSGDVELGRIEGNLTYTSGGSGDFDADYVGGEKLSSKSGGSGSVDIDGGNVTELYVKVGGSGGVHYDGKSTNAELYVSGSGEITVQEPSGSLRKKKRGSGSIRVR